MPMFNVTYEIVTPESAEQGDADKRGFVGYDLTLRDAIGEVRMTRTNAVDGVECIEASCSTICDARWITIVNGMEYETGAQESRSIHIPERVSGASRVRIARLVGCRV